MRRANMDSILWFFWISVVSLSIYLAFSIGPIWQVLKILYIPLSILASSLLFNFRSSSSFSWLSTVFYFAFAGLLVLPILLINLYIPIPWWFIIVAPIQCLLYWNANNRIPRQEEREWIEYAARMGYTWSQLQDRLKGHISQGKQNWPRSIIRYSYIRFLYNLSPSLQREQTYSTHYL